MPSRLRIAVIDDHPIFREGVAQALCSADDLELIAEGSSADEAVEIAQNHLPDVMLLDLNLPGSGLNAVRAISRQCPRVKVMMLTVSSSDEHVEKALECGAHAYVLKGISGPDFIASVRALHEGNHQLTPDVAARLLAKARVVITDHTTELPSLTRREEDILRLLASAHTPQQVAERLQLTEELVADYIGNILQKLHLRSVLTSALAKRH